MRWWIGGGALALALAFRSRRSQPGEPAGDREAWVRLEDAPGLAVRMPSRSWTTPPVRSVLQSAGLVAAQMGGALQVADVAPEMRGASYPPHKSHRWGNDVDVGYTLSEYPTPPGAATDPRLVLVVQSIAPMIEEAFAAPSRIAALAGRGFKIQVWPGHEGHLHLRLRSDLMSRSATT